MARTSNTKTAAKSPSRTSAQQQHMQRSASAPRLPHERDESSDAQQPSPDRVADKAYEDAASERADTSVGPVTDRTYRKLKNG